MEAKPSRLPNVGRPLSERLSPKQESQREQFEEYLEEAKKILGHTTMGLAKLGDLLQLPREIKIGAWVRLWPEVFEVTAKSVPVRPGHQVAQTYVPPTNRRDLAYQALRQQERAHHESLQHAAPLQGGESPIPPRRLQRSRRNGGRRQMLGLRDSIDRVSLGLLPKILGERQVPYLVQSPSSAIKTSS